MATEWRVCTTNGYGQIGVEWQKNEQPTYVQFTPIEYIWCRYYSIDPSMPHSWDLKINGVTNSTGSGTYSYTCHDNQTVVLDNTWTTRAVYKTHSAQTVTLKRTYSDGYVARDNKINGTWTWTLTVPALASYAVKYNANGGSGAPGQQTKWYSETLKLSSTKPTRTGYTFQGWGTTASDTSVNYGSGANYTANAAITLYAIWKANTYAVKFDANGGSGAPGQQTKTYGTTLKLSSTKPTRTNYNFKGWATSKTATSAQYQPGGNYTSNAAVTLYAVWELAYTKPRVTNLIVDRATSAGVISDEGTYAKVSFKWATDKTVSLVKIAWTSLDGPSVSSSVNVSATGTSGTVSQTVGSGALNGEYSYRFYITVSDASGSTEVANGISSTNYVIDVRAGGKGIAFGSAAVDDNVVKVGWEMHLHDELQFFINSIRRAYMKLYENDASYGDIALKMQSDGAMYIGSGSAVDFYNVQNKFPGDNDRLILVSKTNLRIATGYNGNASAGSQVIFNDDGTVDFPKEVRMANRLVVNHDLVLRNNYGLYSKNSNGNNINIMYVSSTDHLHIGNIYNNSAATQQTYVYGGNYINLRVRGDTAKTVRLVSENSNATYEAYFEPNSPKITLGRMAYPWYRLYATMDQAVTSDRKKKKNFVPIGVSEVNTMSRMGSVDKYSEFFDRLQPLQYEMVDGDEKTCFGLVAQDVIDAAKEVGLDPENMDLIQYDDSMAIDDDEHQTYALSYGNFTSLIIYEVQKLKKQNAALQDQLSLAQNTNRMLVKEITSMKQELEAIKEAIQNGNS